MEFYKFPSIENTYRKKTIGIVEQMGKSGGDWIGTLKVHGANFSITTDGVDILPATKNGFIPEGQEFYDYGNVSARYKQKIIDLFHRIKRYIHPTVKQIGVYGEIFGGMYNHPNVPRNPRVSRVMKGVSYCPDQDFYMFALNIDGLWMNFDFVEYCAGLIGCVPPIILGRGALAECLEIPNDTLDPLHKHYNLPPVENNIIEGVVIQPQVPFELPNGKAAIFKNKNERFKEKATKSKKVFIPVIHPKEITDQIDEICLYIVQNRLDNVVSHHGPVEEGDFGVLLGRLSKDVFDDYLIDNADEYGKLTKQQQRIVRKQGQRKCADLVRENFLKLLEM